MRTQGLVSFLIVASVAAGCAAEGGPGSVTAPAGGMSLTVTGTVWDFTGPPLADVLIEVINGARVGEITHTGANGRFAFERPFAYNPLLRASKTGYGAATGGGQVRGEKVEVQFQLTSTMPRLAVDGDYIVTFTAAAECSSLPAEARERRYTASIRSHGAPWYLIRLTGANFVPSTNGYPGTTDFGVLSIRQSEHFISVYFEDPNIWEILRPEVTVWIYGHAEGAVGSDPAQLPLVGEFALCNGSDCTGCESSNHTLTLTRR